MTAGPRGCTPIVVTVPDCGRNARRVGDRCISTGPTGGIPIDTPVIKPIDGCTGAGCGLRHPNLPQVTPTTPSGGRTPPINRLPNLTVSGPNKTFGPTGPATSGPTGGPFVIGRGSGGHNVYTPNLSAAGGTTARALPNAVPNRKGAPPILHGMPIVR